MDTYEMYDIGRSPLHREPKVNNETFPALSVTVNNNSRKKVQRHHTFNASRASYNVPEPGNEYDFRRSPEMRYKRHTASRNSSVRTGSVRPSVPHDTRTRYAMADREECYPGNQNRRVSFDESRCPTPMPQGFQPQTAWDNIDQPDATRRREKLTTDAYSVPSQTPKPKPHRSKQNDVFVSDLDEDGFRRTPVSPLNLTESVINYYFQRKIDKDKRIVKWLVDCEEKSCVTSLPAHLPDISVARSNIPVSP